MLASPGHALVGNRRARFILSLLGQTHVGCLVEELLLLERRVPLRKQTHVENSGSAQSLVKSFASKPFLRRHESFSYLCCGGFFFLHIEGGGILEHLISIKTS